VVSVLVSMTPEAGSIRGSFTKEGPQRCDSWSPQLPHLGRERCIVRTADWPNGRRCSPLQPRSPGSSSSQRRPRRSRRSRYRWPPPAISFCGLVAVFSRSVQATGPSHRCQRRTTTSWARLSSRRPACRVRHKPRMGLALAASWVERASTSPSIGITVRRRKHLALHRQHQRRRSCNWQPSRNTQSRRCLEQHATVQLHREGRGRGAATAQAVPATFGKT
jgi:hypothetical protein